MTSRQFLLTSASHAPTVAMAAWRRNSFVAWADGASEVDSMVSALSEHCNAAYRAA